jgi:hypothetical protein
MVVYCKKHISSSLKVFLLYPEIESLFGDYLIQSCIFILSDRPFPNVSNFWKGVLNNGKTGLFNPACTVAYLGSNLPSNKTEFIRGGRYK